MEVYKGTVSPVEFYLPTGSTTVTSVNYSFKGGTPVTMASTTSGDKATATLPYLPEEGELKVTWNFNVTGSGSFSRTDIYQVVTPVLSLIEVKAIVDEDLSDDEARQIESAVRHIIAAHTGQTFGKWAGKKTVYGYRGNQIALPARLLTLTTINNATLNDDAYRITNNGWVLTTPIRYGVPSVRADFYGLHMDNSGVIHNPNGVSLELFAQNAKFEIDGIWGWDYVPDSVREAAKLLVNDYSCGDALYRDRFLTSMTAADWRIQFHDGAFKDTGNVRANQLLSEYVLNRGWAVI